MKLLNKLSLLAFFLISTMSLWCQEDRFPPPYDTEPFISPLAANRSLARFYRPGPNQEADVAEGNRTQFANELTIKGYKYVGTYGYLFNDPTTLRRWMLLNVKRKANFQRVGKISPRQLPLISNDPPTGGVSSSPGHTGSIINTIGPEHYDRLVSYYSARANDYRATVASQAPKYGYQERKTLGYLITEEGYELLKGLNPSGRLRSELAPVYQFYSPRYADWLLAVNPGDFKHAYAEGYEKWGLIGYIAKVSGQPVQCEDSSEICEGTGEFYIYTDPITGRCYCKRVEPK